MSLIIHFLTKDGIVAISDKRTTVDKDKVNTHYMDATTKTIAFPNMVVVSHCGDNYIDKDKKITVTNFLLEIRKKYGQANGIKEIPLIIVNEYEHKGCESNITLIISGIDLYSMETMVYSVNPKNKNIRLSFVNKSIGLNIPNVGTYGAEYGGMWSITNAVMESEFKIDWDRLTIEGAIDLGKACLKATATAAKYGTIQGVSETYDVYIVSLFSGTGWIIDDKLKPDENAENDARQKYMMEQTEKDLKKQKRLKRNVDKRTNGAAIVTNAMTAF